MKVDHLCPTLCYPHGLYSPWCSPGQNTGVGSLSLLQGIFLNPDLPHCRWILHQLSHQGSPRILEWVAYLFSRGFADPRMDQGSIALQMDSLQLSYQGNPYHLGPLWNNGVREIALPKEWIWSKLDVLLDLRWWFQPRSLCLLVRGSHSSQVVGHP